MHTIIRSTLSGHVYGLTGTFHIRPVVAFRMKYTLSDLLPSSEEGNRSFKIGEVPVVKVQVVLDAPGYNGTKDFTTVIHNEEGITVGEPVYHTVDKSLAYTCLKEENQKRFRIRTKNLLAEISKREVIETNSPLMENSQETLSTIDANIATYKEKINNLLRLASEKPLVKAMPIDSAVKAVMALNLESFAEVSYADMTKELLRIVDEGYSYV